MPALIIRLLSLLLVSLLVGTMFGIWLGFNPKGLSAATYVELQQHTIRALNTALPVLGGVCIVLFIVLAALAGEDPGARRLLIATVVCLVVAGLITRFANQPINREVMTWSLQGPPANWTDLRDTWWNWHVARTVAGLGALVLALFATVRGGPGGA